MFPSLPLRPQTVKNLRLLLEEFPELMFHLVKRMEAIHPNNAIQVRDTVGAAPQLVPRSWGQDDPPLRTKLIAKTFLLASNLLMRPEALQLWDRTFLNAQVMGSSQPDNAIPVLDTVGVPQWRMELKSREHEDVVLK